MHRTASCSGGPLDGQQFTSRFPKGFLVVNRPQAEVVVYDWNGITFVARLRETESVRGRYRAALEPNYDVVAYDAERMGPWAR